MRETQQRNTEEKGHLTERGHQWFTLYNTVRKKNVFAAWEVLLKLCGAEAIVNELWLAHHHPPHTGTIVKKTSVQFMNGLGLANKRAVHQ